MITVINNVRKLKEDKKKMFDSNAIVNEQMGKIIQKITRDLKSKGSALTGKVIIEGRIDEFNCKVSADTDEEAKMIEQIINKAVK